jgi:hypothetical protein
VVRGPDLEEVRSRALVVALPELRQAGGVVELALRALARGSRFLLRGAVLGGAGGERLERRVRLVDIRRDVRVLALLDQQLCGASDGAMRENRGEDLEARKVHVEHVLARRAELAGLCVVPHRGGVVARRAVEVAEVAVRHLPPISARLQRHAARRTHPDALLDHVVRVVLELDLELLALGAVPRRRRVRPRAVGPHRVRERREVRARARRVVRRLQRRVQRGVARPGDRARRVRGRAARERGACGHHVEQPVERRAACARGLSAARSRDGRAARAPE